MRDRGGQVVGNMVVRHVVQEESAKRSKKGSVNRCDGTAHKCPGIFAEVGHRGVGVVQLRDNKY
jgi:hypothetical protein